MPRSSRTHSSTNIYHIVIKGIDRQLIFEEQNDYIKYLEIIEKYKEECKFDLYAYCLMSNHVHLILHVNTISLETIFRKINTHYAVWFNMKYQRTGHLQDGRFHSEPIEDIKYLLTAIKYIHKNPEKAGIEPFPGHSYPWSSIYEYKDMTNKLVDTDYIYKIVSPSAFLESNENLEDSSILDIHKIKHRLPDDVAKDIIFSVCNCKSATDFQKFTLKERSIHLKKLHTLGISLRQLNRLTGISLGIIQKTIAK